MTKILVSEIEVVEIVVTLVTMETVEMVGMVMWLIVYFNIIPSCQCDGWPTGYW